MIIISRVEYLFQLSRVFYARILVGIYYRPTLEAVLKYFIYLCIYVSCFVYKLIIAPVKPRGWLFEAC